MERLFVYISLATFAYGAAILAFTGFNWILWIATLYLVLVAFYYATQVHEKVYLWLCVYTFDGGVGRIFIEADTNELTSTFVKQVEAYLDNNKNTPKPFITNIQLLKDTK